MKTKNKIQIAFAVYIFLAAIFGRTSFGQDLQQTDPISIIQFNGLLKNNLNEVLSDNYYNFTFSIYDSPEGGTPLWTELHKNVFVKNGEFHINLGDVAESTSINLPFDKKYFLGITINDEPEMPQRLEFVSAPYSLGAKYSQSVSDASITTEKFADEAVTNDKIKSFSIDKIVNIPKPIGSVKNLRSTYGSDYEWWTTFGNLIWGPERHFIGTRNDRNFEIQTHEIQRMMFDAYGYILLGTVTDSVNFTVIGFSTFDYVFIQGNLGVGVDPAGAKMHIDAPVGKTPFKVDFNSSNVFNIDEEGRVVITCSVSGNDQSIDNYALYVNGSDQGIGIKIDDPADGNNNYVSFWDDDGMAGRIEGQTPLEYAAEPGNIATDVYLAALIAAEIVAATAYFWPLPIPKEPVDMVRIPIDIAEIVFVMGWELGHTGITYESGSGDYSEWLERINPNEIMEPGDIVSVEGGKISKNTSTSEQFMAISTSPIILGNMPPEEKSHLYEKVAFMGQIPIKVRGPVAKGDYIIPSGLNDGTGIAIEPELLTSDEYSKIVGVAWESSHNEHMKMVNTLIGLSSNDVGKLLSKSEKEDIRIIKTALNNKNNIADLQNKIFQLKSGIQKLNIETTELIKKLGNDISFEQISFIED